jgi:hypothetical protein
MTARGVGVQSLTAFPAGAFAGSDGGLIIGTDVNSIAGAMHSKLAVFPMTSTSAQTPGGPIRSGLFSQGRIGGLDESNSGIAAMCVDDANDSSVSGNPVQFRICQNDAAQNWTIQPDGTIQVNGLCMDTQGGATSNGTPVVADACNGGASQQWRQGPRNTVVNQASGSCLDDPGASTSNGIQLQIWTCSGSIQQVWPLPVAQAPPPPPPAGPVFSAQVQPSSQVPCMDDSRNLSKPGNKIDMWTCLGQPATNWTMESNGTFQINGMCLDTAGGGTSRGTLVVLNTCSGGASQAWTPGANYSLVNQASRLCLDDPGSNTANGTQLQIYSCSGGVNQQWRLPAV